MARRSVICPCGAEFLVPEMPPALLHCPRCGDPVRFHAPAPEPVAPVRHDLQEPRRPLGARNPYYPLYLLGLSGLVVTVALVVLVARFSRVPPIERGVPREAATRAMPPAPKAPSSPAAAPQPSQAPPGPSAGAQRFLEGDVARLQPLLARIDYLGLVTSLALLEKRSEALAGGTAALAREEAELQEVAARLAGRPEVASLDDHWRDGDVLSGLDGDTLDPAHPEAFAPVLKKWLDQAQPGAAVLAIVVRKGAVRALPLWFPDIPADPGPGGPEARRKAPEPPPVLPVELAREARRTLEQMPSSYRELFPEEEVRRAQRLLSEGRGSPEDAAFLRDRFLPGCARALVEQSGYRLKVAALQEALASFGPIDSVGFKDGRRLSCRIQGETETTLSLAVPSGALSVPRSEILDIRRGQEGLAEFRKRYDAAGGRVADLVALLGWCREKNLPPALELTAYAILTSDPGCEAAWEALGHPRRPTAAAGRERDVLWLRDGSRREGILLAESPDEVRLEILVRGSGGDTVGAGQATVPRTEIDRIERMSDAARRRATELESSFVDRLQKSREALGQVRLEPDTVLGVPGLRVRGVLFDLRSTSPEPEVREMAVLLGRLSNVFLKWFSVRRNAGQCVEVELVGLRAEYDNLRKASKISGDATAAFFDPESGRLAAFLGAEKEEEARVRGLIQASEADIELRQRGFTAAEARIASQFRALKEQVLERSLVERRAAGTDAKRLSAVARAQEESLSGLRRQERAARDQLAIERARAHQAIADQERFIQHQEAVIGSQRHGMYEALFHECFHAFVDRFLGEGPGGPGLPPWLEEGLATWTQASRIEAGDLVAGGVCPPLLRLLGAEEGDRRLLPIERIVTGGPEWFLTRHRGTPPRADTATAESWGLVHFLLARGIGRERLEPYVRDVSSGRDPVAAFERLAGRRLDELEAEWRAYLTSLK